MASNLDWSLAMFDRLMEGLTSEYDQRTKDLIGQMFLAGLAEYPKVLEELKSSSLIESDYFDDDAPREVQGRNWRMKIRKGQAPRINQ